MFCSFSSPYSILFTLPSHAPPSSLLSLIPRKPPEALQTMQKQATIQVMGGAWRSPTGIELLKPGSTQMRPLCPAVETPEALTCPLPTFMVAVSCDSELGGFTSDIQEHSKIPRPGSNGATNLQSHYEAHMSSWLHESESQRFLLWELQCQRFPSWPECRIARPQCDQPGLQYHGQPQTASNS